MVKIFFILASLLVFQSLVALRDGYRFLRFVRRNRQRPLRTYQPPVGVIIPCKGVDAHLEANVSHFLGQDYPDYQVIFVVASESDPAYSFLRDRLGRRSGQQISGRVRTSLVVVGYSEERGEKVNNLLQGLRAAEPGTEVLVFTDADARPGGEWLSCLVAPLGDPKVTVNTGFRWYLPGEGFASQLRAAWDTSIATTLGEQSHNFAWCGSMAIQAADFKRLGVAERYGARYWQLAPLVPWVMLWNFVLAGLTARIEWRGTHYELRSINEVRVLRRGEG